MTRRIVLAASLGVLFSAASLLAHHSAATAYDVDKKVTLRGTVTRVEWQNPHVFYYLDVADNSGTVTNWAIEASTPNQLYRRGWRKDDLKIGEEVTLIDSSPARNGSPRAYGGTLTLAGGRKVFSGSAATDQ
jgi:DNA/RNA endonuclease YhcR with UshA esterase domain